MASPVLAALNAQVATTTTVEGGAKVLIDGFKTALEAAVADAISRGASEAEMTAAQALVDALAASSTELAASVAANTPAAAR